MVLDAGYLGKPIGMRFLFTDKEPLSPIESTGGWDHERGEGCRFLRMSNGDWICLPDSVPMLTTASFEDAECTKLVVTYAEPGRTLLQRDVDGFLSHLPPEGVKLIDVGERVEAPYYYVNNDGKCERDGLGGATASLTP